MKIQVVHDKLIVCSQKYAQGILSSDGETIWYDPNFIETNENDYPEVTLVEIEEDEYEIIKAALEVNESIEDTSIEETEDSETEEQDTTTLEFIRSSKISEMDYTCQNVIYAGFDVVLSDEESHHFSLTDADQINLITLSTMIASGETAIPYHADGELCKFYSVEDINTIITTATTFKTYHTSYYNALKMYINVLQTIQEISAIYYGIEIPEDYQSDVLKALYASLCSANA